MGPGTELPDIADVVGRILQRVPRDQQPILLAQRERVSARRYRAWASEITDAVRQSAFLACADREEDIARRVEALYPAAASIQCEILAKRSFVEDAHSAEARKVFLDCAILEQESAAFLESLSGVQP